MKLIRIFGIVLALHVVGALLFIQPGCQSQPQSRPQAADTVPATGSLSDARGATLETVDSESRASPRRPGSSSSRTADRSRQTGQTDLLQPLGSVQISSGRDPAPAPVRTPAPTPTPTLAPIPLTETESGGTYTVRQGDSLWQIADRNGVSMQSLLSINGLSENTIIQPGQKLKLPAGSTVQASAPSSRQPQTAGTTSYKVRSGDSLSRIAQRHNISVVELKRLNGLSSDVIRIDQTLYVPEGGESRPAARSASSSASSSTSTSSSVSSSGATHTVKSGETPGAIAQRYGVTVDELMSANNISDPRRMQIGQKLVIPGETPASGSSSRSSAPAPEPKPVEKEEPKEEPKVTTEDDLFLIPFEDEDDAIPIIPILPQQ